MSFQEFSENRVFIFNAGLICYHLIHIRCRIFIFKVGFVRYHFEFY